MTTTLSELYSFGKKAIGTDCILLAEFFLHADRREIALYPEKVPKQAAEFLAAVEKRKSGYPLQYILGFWHFAGMRLRVRDGVLIPREDTMTLVEAAAGLIGAADCHGLDLCAGSGAVSLALERMCPNAHITALELFDIPLACLQENIKEWSTGRVTAKKFDVLLAAPPHENLDFIVSNPPYISSAELPNLQKEVLHEPKEALDGGEDGLVFYRALATAWKKALRPGGFLAVEIGDDQAEQVKALLLAAGFQNIQLLLDTQCLPRAITAHTACGALPPEEKAG